MSERVFLDDEGATVTDERFVVSGQTYFIRTIASVTTRAAAADRTVPNVAMGLGFLLALYALFVSTTVRLTLATLAIGVVGVAILGWAWSWARDKRTDYYIVLRFTSGTEESIRAEDPDRVAEVVDALGRAIAERGRSR